MLNMKDQTMECLFQSIALLRLIQLIHVKTLLGNRDCVTEDFGREGFCLEGILSTTTFG